MGTMDRKNICWFVHAQTILLLLGLSLASDSQVYIVYMGSKTNEDLEMTASENSFIDMLSSVKVSSDAAESSLLYNYRHVFKGFAAHLTKSEADELAKNSEVILVIPNEMRELHTTHSWEFLGFPQENSYWDVISGTTQAQENIIIGMIDSGIWPESASFRDNGMSPVPSRWKGSCQAGDQFPASSCNKKLIGAKYFRRGLESSARANATLAAQLASASDFLSPRDVIGHGTHTASTAAGRLVTDMSYNGLANGGGKGGAPFARIAMYKACWNFGNGSAGCPDADLLAAFDAAISDGVDIISASIGSTGPTNLQDSISLGSFHATAQGITVVCSAGNDAYNGTVSNNAPWVITVAAGSINRDFYARLQSADLQSVLQSESLNVDSMKGTAMVVAGQDVAVANVNYLNATQCSDGSLDPAKAAGKVILCDNYGDQSAVDQSNSVKAAGGVGAIITNEMSYTPDQASPYAIPTVNFGVDLRTQLNEFLNKTDPTMVRITASSTVFGSNPAPRIASFSSKGPSFLTPDILKPDITAPGLNILAAWSHAAGGMNYNIISGTSMATPHITAIAALIKAANPTWSPAMIKSAMMTTASTTDTSNKPITVNPEGRPATPFDFGGGMVNPIKAMNPGLVYHTWHSDYTGFLCATGIDASAITGTTTACPRIPQKPSNLNYPSISLSKFNGGGSALRYVINVGDPRSTYTAVFTSPSGISMAVSPNILSFNSTGQTLSFTVIFKGFVTPGSWSFGSLTWTNGKINVTSPIAIGGPQ